MTFKQWIDNGATLETNLSFKKKNLDIGITFQKFIGIGIQVEHFSFRENGVSIVIPFMCFFIVWWENNNG